MLLYVSQEVLDEVSEVLRRPVIQKRFPELTVDIIDNFLEGLEVFAVLLKKVPREFSYTRDVDDEIYVNLAIAAEAEFLVSRDSDLLDLMTAYDDESKNLRRRFRGLKVVEPVEFLDRVRNLEKAK